MKHFLDSQRLSLREISRDDLTLLFELHSDPEVMKYIRPAEKTIAETSQTMEKIFRTNDYQKGLGLWICEEKNSHSFVGWFVLKSLDVTGDIEIGYRLLRKCWGKGYATEMSKVLMSHGFEILRLNKIAGATHPDNKSSQHVLEKIGMKFSRIEKIHSIDAWYYEKYR